MTSLNLRPKTIFCDIDGTLVKHFGNAYTQMKQKPEMLPGVIEKMTEWDQKGYTVILVTGRRESFREETVKQLTNLGIHFDHLIMSIGSGQRVLINDLKSNSKAPTAIAVNIERNKGLEDIEV